MIIRPICTTFSYLFLTLLLIGCNGQLEKEEARLWTEEDKLELLNGLVYSHDSLLLLIQPLNEEQWNYKLNDDTWSIAEITEHLGLQQDMHFREVYVLSKTPPSPEFVDAAKAGEIKIKGYATDTTQGDATWNVLPLGRWCSKEDAVNQFKITRDHFIDFINTTKADLRKHFTFRDLPDKSDYRNVRDLHQIVLTTITHTERHTLQIKTILENPGFPD